LITAPLYPQYSYGDELKIKCSLEEPKNYADSKFDYQMYLAKDRIYRICNKAQITVVSKNKGNKLYTFILAVKNKFEEKLSAIFPDPEGAYLKGLLLGGSKRMTKDLSEAFQRTGITHTVAVSGYNVTIVAAFLMWLGIWLGLWRQQVFSFAVIGIVLFVLMTGAPSSAVRAGIMGGLVIWAMKEGRLANSTNAILLAAGAMLAINPLLLRYDAGFQLSFLATIGIVQLSPILEKFWWGRPPKLIQETIILTMSAMVFVLPIILNSFEKISLVSPIANFENCNCAAGAQEKTCLTIPGHFGLHCCAVCHFVLHIPMRRMRRFPLSSPRHARRKQRTNRWRPYRLSPARKSNSVSRARWKTRCAVCRAWISAIMAGADGPHRFSCAARNPTMCWCWWMG